MLCPRFSTSVIARAFALTTGLPSAGCEKAAPTSLASPRTTASASLAAASPCTPAARTQRDKLPDAWFPTVLGSFCVDPHADARAYGRARPLPLRAACELLGGDCERFARFGLAEVLSVSFVDGAGPARLGLTVLEFSGQEAAYAYFTERGRGETAAGGGAWQEFEAGAAALRSGATAIVVKEARVAELVYTDERAPPPRARERAGELLSLLARELAQALPGKSELPRSAALLPKDHREPLSVRYEHGDALGLGGLGPGALAAYAEPDRRYYVAVLARRDEDSAKDVERVLARVSGARALKGAPIAARSVSLRQEESGERIDWLFGRKRDVVFGVGSARSSGTKREALLARDAKILRLKRLFDGL